MDFAETKSSRSSLRDTNSPQYKAVEWLAQDKIDNGSNWSGYELLQRYVLRILFHSTGGDSWAGPNFDASTTWFGASSVCNWGSIDAECNGNGQVDRIDLSQNNLQGAIPDELWQLTAMAYLDLRLNQELTGTIPTQIGQLTALTWLSLSGIQLSGTIATQFGLLSDLRYLYLSHNELTGTIPTQLGQLTGLRALYMHENQLTGSIPATLPQSTDLDFIFLYNNFLTGQVPSAFCAAPFPDWRADGPNLPGKTFWTDCISEVQCDCCDRCYDESGKCFRWNGSGFSSC